MNKFKNLMERSKAINHFAKVERMSQDEIYELYFESFKAYETIFTERIRYGSHLRRIISEYKSIPEFGILKPSQLGRIIFTSRKMAYWFAFAFWKAIDAQVSSGNIDRAELQLSLTFYPHIPSASIMEEILYEQTTKKADDSLSACRQTREAEREARAVTV